MAEPFDITVKSPERGWPPFLDWMRAQGLEPGDARSLHVDPDAMTADVVELVSPRRADRSGVRMATRPPRTVSIASLPPRRA